MEGSIYGGIKAAGKSTWAARPSASSYNGLMWLMTDIGKGHNFISDGTDWFPIGGKAGGEVMTAPATISGTTNKIPLFTGTIPGGLMGLRGVIRIHMQWSASNNANNKNPAIRIGSTDFWTPSGASFLSAWGYVEVANMNSKSSQLGTNKGLMSMIGATAASSGQAGTENTDNDLLLTVSAQLANSEDSITLHRARWELLK